MEKALKNKIKDLEEEISILKVKNEDLIELYEAEKEKKQFYELIAEFTHGWEIWITPEGKLTYASPSCYDLTGFTANQLMKSDSFVDQILHQSDKTSFEHFLSNSLSQSSMDQSHEFRILTRHKQIRWCSLSVRGVYNQQGRYLGIRGSITDITHLKQALGQIRNLSAGKEIENKAKLRFKSELDLKERELVSFLLQLSKKNEYLAYAVNNLRKILQEPAAKTKEKITQLLNVLEDIPPGPVDWEMILLQIENLHPGFLTRLMTKHPTLTQKEKKLCAFLRLDLSSKDISGLQNVQSKSVEIARVRLRKKLKLDRDTRLNSYINSI